MLLAISLKLKADDTCVGRAMARRPATLRTSVIREEEHNSLLPEPRVLQGRGDLSYRIVHGSDHGQVCPPVWVLHLGVQLQVLLGGLQGAVHILQDLVRRSGTRTPGKGGRGTGDAQGRGPL